MPLHPLTRFFLELKRRRVTRVAIAYGVAAGALMQSASVIFPALHLPDWTITFLVALCLGGFPVALALAWAFDLTPRGLRAPDRAPREEAAPVGPRRHRHLGFVVAALLLLVVAGVAFFAVRPRHGAAGPMREVPVRLAVLYFDDLSPDGSLTYLAEGITGELIDHLSEVRALNVVSRNGVAPFRGGRVPLDSIARALRATLLVNGTIRRAGDSVRISVQLSDTAGTVLAHQTLDEGWSESFALVDDVVHQVATALRRSVGEEVQVKQWQAGTRNEDAWRGLQLARSRTGDLDKMVAAGDVASGVRMLEAADTALAAVERLDPHWVEPVVQRAWNGGRIALIARQYLNDPDLAGRALTRALVYAGHAVALAPGDAGALEVRGNLRDEAARTLPLPAAGAAALEDSAQQDLVAAVALDPVRAHAWATLASMRRRQDRLGEARVAAERAYEADAYLENAWEIVTVLFSTSFELGDDAAARRWCDETKRLRAAGRVAQAHPVAYCSLQLLAWAEPAPRPNTDPWRHVDAARRDPPPVAAAEVPRLELLAAAVLARTGRADSARAVAARARAAAPHDPGADYYDAALRLLLDDRAGALADLRTFADWDLPGSRQVAAGRMFRRLHGDPTYEGLLLRMH